MGNKTISILDDVYSKKPKLSNFYGMWKMSDEEEKAIFKELKSLWGGWKID